MTEKLGALLVDVPEPKYFKYSYMEYAEMANERLAEHGCNLAKQEEL